MDSNQRQLCRVQEQVPELYFCNDMKGYGWCFRKRNYLNVGLGRMDQHRLSEHVGTFVRFLKAQGRVRFDLSAPMLGHAYLLRGCAKREVAGDGFVLVGDAAGLAYAQSGEGIRPAIESGLMAAEAIVRAGGRYTGTALEPYREMLRSRFGETPGDWASTVGRRLPDTWRSTAGRLLLRTGWFTRKLVLDRWFLHSAQPALKLGALPMAAEVRSASV
jgi:2-polyprenyl-6-methoxyphenol hydroxylase-like FAD-dependent oxidoreductase